MKEYKIKPIISLDALKWSLRMCAFWRTKHKDYYMGSGYLLEYTDKATNETSLLECLDYDHVYTELEALGFDEQTCKFITKHC